MKLLYRATLPALVVLVLLAASGDTAFGQLLYTSGQNVVPVFEGWERQPDGSFNMLFGYFNRNREEIVDIPIGTDNKIEPGPADRGQPTHFYPSRNRYWFRVPVPADFGSKELVWTLTVRGKTERAFATLNPNYAIDASVEQLDTAGINLWWAEEGVNKPPSVRVEGELRRHARVGQSVLLTAVASDDGIPPAPKVAERRARYAWHGLRVVWFIDRGAGRVTFDPGQFKVYPDAGSNSPWTPGWTAPPIPADHKYPVNVTFHDPGEYIVRVMAHDGGLATTADVRVTVE
jgi:hypothetical protein